MEELHNQVQELTAALHVQQQMNQQLQQQLQQVQAQIQVQPPPHDVILNQLNQNEQNRQERERQVGVNVRERKLIDEIVNQIDTCDGSSPQAVRKWLQCIATSTLRTGEGPLTIKIASRTVKGSLQREIERYLHDRVNDPVQPVHERELVPWEDLKAYIVRSYLPIDNIASIRDELDKIRQSPYEAEASYNRRFREVADEAYPPANRNEDQNALLVKAYVRGLQSSDIAREVVLRDRPNTLPQAMEQVLQAAAGKEAYNRLGRKEVPMEIGALSTSSEKNPIQLAVEQLNTTVAKLEVQTRQMNKQSNHTKQQRTPTPKYDHKRPPPSCYNCGRIGHIQRDCRLKKPQQMRFSQSQTARNPYCTFHKSYGHDTRDCRSCKIQRQHQGN